MLALGAAGSRDPAKYLQLGADLANTCHESYIRTSKYCYSISLKQVRHFQCD
jgi:hypothetical protein